MNALQELTLPQVAERWGISKVGVKARAKLLGVKLKQISSTCSVWPAEYLELGDLYHQHLKAGGTKNDWKGPLAPAATAPTITTAEPLADPLLRARQMAAIAKEDLWLRPAEFAQVVGLKRLKGSHHNLLRDGFVWHRAQGLWSCKKLSPSLPAAHSEPA